MVCPRQTTRFVSEVKDLHLAFKVSSYVNMNYTLFVL